MKTPFLPLILAAVLVAVGVLPAAAEKADRDKPMNIEADALRYDDLNQSSVFTGNVVITKGSLLIRGGQVNVRQDAQGYQNAVATAAPGKLAYYRNKRDGVDEFIEGEGERIEYDGHTDQVKFINRAVVRRFKGATLADETTGALIVYNNTTDVFSVDSGAQNRSAANPSGRVRAILSPRSTASTPVAPATPPVATHLRVSPTLGSSSNPNQKAP